MAAVGNWLYKKIRTEKIEFEAENLPAVCCATTRCHKVIGHGIMCHGGKTVRWVLDPLCSRCQREQTKHSGISICTPFDRFCHGMGLQRIEGFMRWVEVKRGLWVVDFFISHAKYGDQITC